MADSDPKTLSARERQRQRVVSVVPGLYEKSPGRAYRYVIGWVFASLSIFAALSFSAVLDYRTQYDGKVTTGRVTSVSSGKRTSSLKVLMPGGRVIEIDAYHASDRVRVGADVAVRQAGNGDAALAEDNVFVRALLVLAIWTLAVLWALHEWRVLIRIERQIPRPD